MSPIEGRSENRGRYAHQRNAHLAGKDFRVDNISCAIVLLVRREDDLDVSAVCCSGECHIQLSVRESRDAKVNSDAFDRLALGFVDRDREREPQGELTTFQFEGKVPIVFGWGKRDPRDEFGSAVEVTSNDLDL